VSQSSNYDPVETQKKSASAPRFKNLLGQDEGTLLAWVFSDSSLSVLEQCNMSGAQHRELAEKGQCADAPAAVLDLWQSGRLAYGLQWPNGLVQAFHPERWQLITNTTYSRAYPLYAGNAKKIESASEDAAVRQALFSSLSSWASHERRETQLADKIESGDLTIDELRSTFSATTAAEHKQKNQEFKRNPVDSRKRLGEITFSKFCCIISPAADGDMRAPALFEFFGGANATPKEDANEQSNKAKAPKPKTALVAKRHVAPQSSDLSDDEWQDDAAQPRNKQRRTRRVDDKQKDSAVGAGGTSLGEGVEQGDGASDPPSVVRRKAGRPRKNVPPTTSASSTAAASGASTQAPVRRGPGRPSLPRVDEAAKESVQSNSTSGGAAATEQQQQQQQQQEEQSSGDESPPNAQISSSSASATDQAAGASLLTLTNSSAKKAERAPGVRLRALNRLSARISSGRASAQASTVTLATEQAASSTSSALQQAPQPSTHDADAVNLADSAAWYEFRPLLGEFIDDVVAGRDGENEALLYNDSPTVRSEYADTLARIGGAGFRTFAAFVYETAVTKDTSAYALFAARFAAPLYESAHVNFLCPLVYRRLCAVARAHQLGVDGAERFVLPLNLLTEIESHQRRSQKRQDE
jgi:hypothetical protein